MVEIADRENLRREDNDSLRIPAIERVSDEQSEGHSESSQILPGILEQLENGPTSRKGSWNLGMQFAHVMDAHGHTFDRTQIEDVTDVFLHYVGRTQNPMPREAIDSLLRLRVTPRFPSREDQTAPNMLKQLGYYDRDTTDQVDQALANPLAAFLK